MKQRGTQHLLRFLGVQVLLAAVAALGATSAMASGHAQSQAAAPIKTTSAHILVTPKGKTLYVFAADPKGKSTCSGECAKFWPPRLVPSGRTVPAKLPGVPGTFGTITRTDGTREPTYDGAPLYTFLEDKKAGDMIGQGLLASGGYWWVVV